MCGIAGYYGQGTREILEKMTRALSHRGPDDEGFFLDEKIGLGHRRLSIIDLSPAGHQPMANEDGSIRVVFNGEIYNFLGLKKELRQSHQFKSQTDTEVILHLYEEMGEKLFDKLEGMFALAIYDQNKSGLFLVRDRMGKKPLYWSLQDKTLIFGSELKALIQHPAIKKELDFISLNEYLTYEYVPTPRTILKNVHKLDPGCYLYFDGRKVVKEKFWDIVFNRNNQSEKYEKADLKNLLSNLDTKLGEAVGKRMVSDVPLGIFLSGGIDSSTVAYYAQKACQTKVKTFSIGFKEKSFDESAYAREVAAYLKTEHREKLFSVDECLDALGKVSECLDEPLADPSILPTFLLSKFAREEVAVALGGDGGDELFFGYDTFIAHRLEKWYERIPFGFRKNFIEKLAFNLPVSFNNISLDFKAKSFINGFYGDRKYRYQRWLGSFDRSQKEKLFRPEVWSELKNENEFTEIDNYLNQSNLAHESYFNQLAYLYQRTYLMDDILVKVDRASMMNSLEVRAPLLDTDVVDFANSLPVELKLKGLKTKFILKKLMEDKLPREIIYRKKKGFGIPVAEWISGPLKPLVLEKLGQKNIEKQGIFDYNYIRGLLDDHFHKKADNRKLIWTLLAFELWREKFLVN